MGFLNRILNRPSHEKPFLLLVVGHPAEDARVPDISRKLVTEISSFVSPASAAMSVRPRERAHGTGFNQESGKT
jgi:hypothetical protein